MNRDKKIRFWDGSQWSYFVIGQLWSDWMLSVYNDHVLNGREPFEYTGLKDRNGNEIYFKDIVKSPSGNYFVVEWYEQEMRIVLKRQDTLYGFNVPSYEVVGNVFENPELI